MSEQCNGIWAYCDNLATIERNGKWYCVDCAPELIPYQKIFRLNDIKYLLREHKIEDILDALSEATGKTIKEVVLCRDCIFSNIATIHNPDRSIECSCPKFFYTANIDAHTENNDGFEYWDGEGYAAGFNPMENFSCIHGKRKPPLGSVVKESLITEEDL